MKRRIAFGMVTLVAFLANMATSALATPMTIYFSSADGQTPLVGYLFAPSTPGQHPAVVMLHGRAGPYSTNVSDNCTLVARNVASDCNASTLSKRHEAWGEYWAEHGFIALLPDSFGPRGKGYGFGRDSHDDPDRDDVNERTVRPLDAEGALKYLRTRPDVAPARIFLQGWSNGASTTLNVMYRQALAKTNGFRAAIAMYPGCGPRALISADWTTNAPVTVFLGTDDEEVSPAICHRVLDAAGSKGNAISLIDYIGATHDFDDPGRKRQSVPGNAVARDDVLQRAVQIFGR